MNFKKNTGFKAIGMVFGFVFAYFVFTTILFFILSLLGKLPQNNPLLRTMDITIIIAIAGLIIKRLLR